MNLKLTEEEARAVLHCLKRTHAKGDSLTISMRIEDRIEKLINKPVETTNEQPNNFSSEQVCEIEKVLLERFGSEFVKEIVKRLLEK